MLERVVTAIEQSGVADSVTVSSDDSNVISGTPVLAALSSTGFLRFHRSGASPASSVAEFVDSSSREWPVFVTTGDHPLLTPQIIRHFVEHASRSQADFLVGLVPASVYRRRFPDQPRTFIPLRGERYSGANLFLLRTPNASAVARFWTRAEEHRKTPWRLVRVFGMVTLLEFLLGRLDLDAALARVARTIGASIEAVELPFAEAALDVDKESDRIAVEAVFAERAASSGD